jgi:transposase
MINTRSLTLAKNVMNKPNYEVKLMPQLEKACGLDLHKDKIVGFISDKEGNQQELTEYGTFTDDLLRIKDWLLTHDIQYCLMESTGVYWIGLYNVLTEAGIQVVVANPLHIRQIPKRKTDRKDARWLCTLLLNGLARQSFVPDAIQQRLRDLCRNRLFYTQSQTKTTNRIVKILERANIKIRSVSSMIATKSTLEIIRLMAAGENDIEKLLTCLRGKLKSKKENMRLALKGVLSESDRQILGLLLADYDHAEKQKQQIEKITKEVIKERYQEIYELLQEISGVGPKGAEIIIAEIGDNMQQFPSADHLTSWVGVAPGNNESAGKARTVGTKKGNKYMRVAMVTIAWGAVRTKDSYWKALFEHFRKRMKAQKAIIAIARRMLKVIYKVIDQKIKYQEKGINHFLDLQRRNAERVQLSRVPNN